MASVQVQSLRQTVTVDWPKLQEAQAKDLLLRVGREGHARIMADAGQTKPDFDAYANSPGNTNLDSVIVPGPIVYRYRYLRNVISDVLDALRKASPVLSGDYVRSHTLFIDGTATDKPPLNLPRDAEIMISNPVPYARRIEVGKTESGRAFVIQVQPNVYERVARAMNTKYRNVAKISFGYATLPDAHTIKGGLGARYVAKGGASRKRRQAVGKQVQAPAIFIEVLT
jgi:hypothetical protein